MTPGSKITYHINVLPVLLLVERDAWLRHHIKEVLGRAYMFFDAQNWEEGIQKAFRIVPDLIIGGVYMPEMEGQGFCKKIQADSRTSHIPFIILAETTYDKIGGAGLQIGVDEYLMKPINGDILKMKVQNIILQLRQVQLKLQKELHHDFFNKKKQTGKHGFIDRLRIIIEQNIGEGELSVGFLSKKLGMSRVQVYRKTHALTGLTASQFIRMIRLRKASSLLQLQSGTVSEIAYSVGFNNLSYFSKCFREMYGQTPSRYLSIVHGSNRPDA